MGLVYSCLEEKKEWIKYNNDHSLDFWRGSFLSLILPLRDFHFEVLDVSLFGQLYHNRQDKIQYEKFRCAGGRESGSVHCDVHVQGGSRGLDH